MRKTILIIIIPFIALTLLMVCAATKHDTGYLLIQHNISKDSAEHYKNNIRSISTDIFQPFQYTGQNNITIQYRLLSPKTGHEKDTYPLVLVLHGSGAIGTDNSSQMGVLAKYWAQPSICGKYPAYVVAPQFPQRSSNYSMDAERKVLSSSPGLCLSTALQLIDSLKKVLPVNQKKIYVVGFSMGGSSALNVLSLRPGMFAAAISISGIPEMERAYTLTNTPIWLIHGNADDENPFGSDSLFYKELLSLGARHSRFWEIDNWSHDIYYQLYTTKAMPKWLFSH
jgi:predicted peptidase